MKILMIGLDRHIFTEGTEARGRIAGYGAIAEEVRLIMFAKKSLGLTETQLAPNVWAYPTNSTSRLWYIRDAIRIGKRLPRHDIVSAQDAAECSLAAFPIARSMKAIFHIQLHIDPFDRYFLKESRLNPLRAFIARRMLVRADCVRVVSERIRESLVTHKIVLRCAPIVLPVYVATATFENAKPVVVLHTKYPQFNFIILMACRLVTQKDLPTAFHALKLLMKQNPRAGLVLVGEGPLQERLAALSRELLIGSNVVFEPWQKDMTSYFKTADVFLMTSFHEGYPRTLIEAAAAGVPIVTTEVGPVGSVLRDHREVLACPVGDVACIARALEAYLNDLGLRATMKLAAQNVARTAIAPDFPAYLALLKDSFLRCKKGE